MRAQRAQRVEREKRVSALGMQVVVALGDRDEVVARCERRAGEALRAMTEGEGLAVEGVVADAVPAPSSPTKAAARAARRSRHDARPVVGCRLVMG